MRKLGSWVLNPVSIGSGLQLPRPLSTYPKAQGEKNKTKKQQFLLSKGKENLSGSGVSQCLLGLKARLVKYICDVCECAVAHKSTELSVISDDIGGDAYLPVG